MRTYVKSYARKRRRVCRKFNEDLRLPTAGKPKAATKRIIHEPCTVIMDDGSQCGLPAHYIVEKDLYCRERHHDLAFEEAGRYRHPGDLNWTEREEALLAACI